MPLLQVIIASTRPGRKGPAVADWFLAQAGSGGFDLERVDLADVNLPLFDEPHHPRLRDYQHEHTKRWSAIVQRADAFVVVTPEYDFGPPAAITNAFQFLVLEWAYKPVGIVSYGGVSAGTRSAQGIRLLTNALKMVAVLEAVSIPFFGQHLDKQTGAFNPGKVQDDAAAAMVKELMRWHGALATLRR